MRNKVGDTELDRRDGVADALALRMSEMPAWTVAGVAAKLRWVHHFQRVHGQLESPIERCQEVCVRTALAGLVRVAGRARRNGAFGDATAVRCSSDSMRAYWAGDILYVSPTKPVVQGRNVLVELRDYSEIVGRFVSQSDTELVLHQNHPDKELRFPLGEVRRVRRIVGTVEDL